ncbi:hypothetical protein HELRODRAFT_170526 [Helobdella robusta]|uniref:Uncharacterized protein n=1 Tax=Helobdella robusta TaxID=6412 RepID=T1F358_HELRO|nr:hypothetical protein HELRODRAFT_170526 [Helobdella robusta]ESO07215.1 hypothetical protein HELRODRAFT_170526 [Helobdella robusta]
MFNCLTVFNSHVTVPWGVDELRFHLDNYFYESSSSSSSLPLVSSSASTDTTTTSTTTISSSNNNIKDKMLQQSANDDIGINSCDPLKSKVCQKTIEVMQSDCQELKYKKLMLEEQLNAKLQMLKDICLQEAKSSVESLFLNLSNDGLKIASK